MGNSLLAVRGINHKYIVVVDGTTFDELCIDKETGKTRATKDKYIVIPKMELLEKLMLEYLGINKKNTEEIDEETFIADVVSMDKSEVYKNINIYKEDLNGTDNLRGLKDNCIRDGSKLLDSQNNLSLLAMVAYSYKIGQDLDEWLTEYASKNNTYFVDQQKNYYYMRNDFDKYLRKGKVA